MDLVEKKELLSYYQFIRADIFIAKDEITDLRLSMLPGGMNISDMPKNPNARDRMADYGADFDQAYRTLQKYRRWAKVITEGIKTARRGVGREILHHRYVMGFSWAQVARRVRYSTRQCQNIANDALRSARFDETAARQIINHYRMETAYKDATSE